MKYLSQHNQKQSIGLCKLATHSQVHLLLWSIITFYFYSGYILPVFAIDDGTLTQKDIVLLKSLFQIRIISHTESGTILRKRFKQYPYFLKYRFGKHTFYNKHRFDVFLLSPYEKNICFDNDVLWLQKPQKIIEWIKNEVDYSLYSRYSESIIEHFRINQNSEFSLRKCLEQMVHLKEDALLISGLLCIHDKKIINLQLLEKLFKVYDTIGYSGSYFAEECALSFLFNRNAYPLDPIKYLTVSAPEHLDQNIQLKAICIHYAYIMKPYFSHQLRHSVVRMTSRIITHRICG